MRRAKTDEWRARFSEAARSARQPRPEQVAETMMKRCSSMISSLRSRCKETGQECLVTLDEMRELVLDAYGKPCRYCREPMKHTKSKSLSPDHVIPMSDGGGTVLDNIELICSKCNRRKDRIRPENFQALMDEVNTWQADDRASVLTRLTVGGMHFARKRSGQ